MDKESSRGIGMRLLALRLNNHNLIFFGSPLPALALAKAAVGKSTLRRAPQGDALCVPPPFRHLLITHTHTYTHTDYKLLHIHTQICIHFPNPDPTPPSLWTASLTSGSVTSAAGLAAGPDGCLPELDYLPCCKVVCLCCIMCFLLGCFSCSHTVLPKEHSMGIIFFSSLSSCLLYFSSKNPCISLLIVFCMIVYVTNKPTLTLTLTSFA